MPSTSGPARSASGSSRCRYTPISATKSRDVHLVPLEAATGTRIRYRRVSEQTGDEVPNDRIVKGYEITPGPVRHDHRRRDAGPGPQGESDDRHRGLRRPRRHRSRCSSSSPTTSRPDRTREAGTGSCSDRRSTELRKVAIGHFRDAGRRSCLGGDPPRRRPALTWRRCATRTRSSHRGGDRRRRWRRVTSPPSASSRWR